MIYLEFRFWVEDTVQANQGPNVGNPKLMWCWKNFASSKIKPQHPGMKGGFKLRDL